ncbi:MAG TPA: formate dehydrogenase subunit gamma [Burkholderiaceae bacterium]|nr:formate dehydrogenase subunit gamma [Burkholderiaceae bacterium]
MLALISRLILAAGLALPLAVGAQTAPADAATAAAQAAVPDEPRADETNAERAKSQPGNNAPFWRAVRDSGEQAGYTSLPAPEAGVLIQRQVQYPGSMRTTAGEAWRQVRNQWILPYGGALIVITLVAIALFYWRKGAMGSDVSGTRGTIERFTYFERAAHWVNAIAFSVLAISGLVMAFGKFFLLPILGGTLFGWLTYLLKNLHNFAGPLFAVSLVVVLLTFVRDNLPTRDDLVWLAKGGGLFSGQHVPSHRFNAGEKIVFWAGVFLLGLVTVGSGLVLDKVVPGMDYTRGTMQVAHMIHGVATMLMMALFIGHIYMGTIGVKGAYRAMKTGYVDEAWAKEHHELWYDDIRAGKIPAQRSQPAQPAATPRQA